MLFSYSDHNRTPQIVGGDLMQHLQDTKIVEKYYDVIERPAPLLMIEHSKKLDLTATIKPGTLAFDIFNSTSFYHQELQKEDLAAKVRYSTQSGNSFVETVLKKGESQHLSPHKGL